MSTRRDGGGRSTAGSNAQARVVSVSGTCRDGGKCGKQPTTLTLPEPSFDFFRINVVAGLEYTANAFMDVFVDPQPFQTEPVGAGETAAGLDGLTLVLSILKILIALLAVVLSKLDSTLVEDNWKFYDIARCTTIEEAIMVVDKRSQIKRV